MKRARTKDENKVEYGTISLPMPLIDKIKQRIDGTGINSPSAFVTFILRQIFSSPDANASEVFSKKEEEEVKERLKKLGYYT